MNSLALIYWLAGAGAIGLLIYLGYALLRPEKF
ncbi:K(+)-transporting ATPase subunit F [Ottowia sp. VDI28]